MSGGSWDYLCYKMEEAADRLSHSKCPHRKAFAILMYKCATAMHDIEWVDSCDKRDGDEIEAISAVLGGVDTTELITSYRNEAQALVERLDAMLANKEHKP